MTPEDQQFIEQAAAAKMARPDPFAPKPQETPVAPPQNQPEKATSNEQVQEAGAPQTEGDLSGAESVTYVDVEFGEGDTRRLSTAQIRDTMKRYRDLNYKHQTQIAPNQPVFEFANSIMENARANGQEVSPQDVVGFLQAAAQAYASNPTMGQQHAPPGPQGQPVQGQPKAMFPNDVEAQMRQWEEENAISLPPAYRDAMGQVGHLQQENMQIKQMMQQILQQAQGLNDGAQGQMQQVHQQEIQNMRTLAASNLNQAQQRHGLPDEDEQDFFTYAYERGYTPEDFVDPQLTDKVVADFKNTKQSPEMERLREMAKRRTAYTGNIGSQPSVGGQPPAVDPGQQYIDSMAESIMKQRNMM